jgi:Ca2+-binding RTX toxin-like protein
MTGLGANAFSGITGRVLVYGLGGNDTLNVSTVKIATQLYGGDGHDILLGGAAGDLLYGGAGNDMILGGLGADILYGEAGNDILVDGNMALKLPLSDTLYKVLATWNSQPAPTIAIYNNITTRITPGFDRSAQDRLIGGSGIDWFWSATAGALADITDIVAGEKRRVV